MAKDKARETGLPWGLINQGSRSICKPIDTPSDLIGLKDIPKSKWVRQPLTGLSTTEYAQNRVEDSMMIDIVFDGPPSHESGRFVEVENMKGQSIRIGEWIDRGEPEWCEGAAL